MAYMNLKAEMTRYNIRIKDVASSVGITERALRNKLNGVTEFSWKQVCKIQKQFFPDISKDYLFYQEGDTELNEEEVS